MPSRVIVVSGLPASGKTTLATALAEQLSWPLISKDDFKTVLHEHLPQLSPAEAGPLSFALMWRAAEVQLRAEADFILETHFHRPQSEEVLRDLRERFQPALRQIFCHAPLTELQRRHDARVTSGTRPQIDRPFDFAQLLPNWGFVPLDLGEGVPLLTLDTTREGTLEQALCWLESQF